MSFSNLTLLDRYVVTEKIGEGGMSEVFLGKDLVSDTRVAVKLLKSHSLSNRIEDIIRFRFEASTILNMDHPSIVKVFEVGDVDTIEAGTVPFIVMEYLDGSNLQDTIRQSMKSSIEKNLTIFMSITEALEYIHNKGIVHKDLKPGNIIVDKRGRVKLIDFGMAQMKDLSRISDRDLIIGTISYMSPEQSGILKRGVDERSDLYSLGILGYQLFTGELPFNSTEISALIHQHIAKIPDNPSTINPKIPLSLEKIILKLIEKEPEKRYQTARSLLNDLKLLRDGKEAFEIDRSDIIGSLTYHAELAGRGNEMARLCKFYIDGIAGKGRVCVVSGEAGIGKTRLLEEIRGLALTKGIPCIEGRNYSGTSLKTPYHSLREAIEEYIRHFGRYPKEKQDAVRAAVREKTGDLGEILIKLSPLTRELIGECKPLEEIEIEKENQRFLTFISSFLTALADIEQGMVLMLEDIHYADDGTVSILNELSHSIQGHHLFVAASYRPDDVPKSSKLEHFLHDNPDFAKTAFEIRLNPLGLEESRKLAGEILSGEMIEAGTLDEVNEKIYDKGRGNPFFTIELIRQMIEARILYPDQKRWKFNRAAAQKLEYSRSVVDTLMKKIHALPGDAREIVAVAAVFGKRIPLGFLLRMFPGMPPDNIVSAVTQAVKLNLLSEISGERGYAYFAHDRVREAFYNLNSPEMKMALHLRAATLIEESDEYKENPSLYVFDLVRHFIDTDNEDKLLHYASKAGRIAKEAFAYEEAISYHEICRMRFWERENIPDWLHAQIEIANLNLTIGNNDLAIEFFKEALSFIKDPFEKSRVYCKLGKAYYQKANMELFEKYARLGLALLGDRLPKSRTIALIGFFKEMIKYFFLKLIPKPKHITRNPRKREKMRLRFEFYRFLNIGYGLSDPLKSIRAIMRSMNFTSWYLPNTPENINALSMYATLLTYGKQFSMADKVFRKAIAIGEKIGSSDAKTNAQFFYGLHKQWAGEFQESMELFRKRMEYLDQIGDLKEKVLVVNNIINDYIYTGDYSNAEEMNRKFQQIGLSSKDNYAVAAFHQEQMLIHLERGEIQQSIQYGKLAIEEGKKQDQIFVYAQALIHLANVLMEKGEYSEGKQLIREGRLLHEKYRFMYQYVDLLYPIEAEIYLAEYLSTQYLLKPGEKSEALKKISALCRTALRKTRHIATFYPNALRVNAKFLFASGYTNMSSNYFQRSIDAAKKINRRYETGRGYYEYGLAMKQMQRYSESHALFEEAYKIFWEIDSRMYLQRCSELLGIQSNKAESSTSIERLKYKERLSSVIAITRDISSILNINELLDHILRKAIEVTGAQRGYLFLAEPLDNELLLKVKYDISGAQTEEYSRNIIRTVSETKKALLTTNAEADAELIRFQSIVRYNLKSVLCVPILRHESLVGVCYLDNPLSSFVFTDEDIELLNVFMSQAAVAIENARIYAELDAFSRSLEQKVEERTRELSAAYERLKENDRAMMQDLKLAKTFQERLLPSADIDLPGIELITKYLPLNMVGGDFYDISEIKPGWFRVFIADASGHGVPAALITMIIKSEYEKLKHLIEKPSELLEVLNNEFLISYYHLAVFFTSFIADIRMKEHRIDFSCAGHPYQFLIRKNIVERLGSPGKLVGFKSNEVYMSNSVAFEKGTRLFLFSDGLFEEFNEKGSEYGEERLLAAVDEHRKRTLTDMTDAVVSDVLLFANNTELNDDITVIAMEFNGKK
ncbi:MAG: hypothetical protein A2Y33_06015 [Spirochaetes bacterium GWF1_51_8]|nr:MAG: hypothetical protein A2Y33_06015 [Spirochaetes bacterium GWF1_51_8]